MQRLEPAPARARHDQIGIVLQQEQQIARDHHHRVIPCRGSLIQSVFPCAASTQKKIPLLRLENPKNASLEVVLRSCDREQGRARIVRGAADP